MSHKPSYITSLVDRRARKILVWLACMSRTPNLISSFLSSLSTFPLCPSSTVSPSSKSNNTIRSYSMSIEQCTIAIVIFPKVSPIPLHLDFDQVEFMMTSLVSIHDENGIKHLTITPVKDYLPLWKIFNHLIQC